MDKPKNWQEHIDKFIEKFLCKEEGSKVPLPFLQCVYLAYCSCIDQAPIDFHILLQHIQNTFQVDRPMCDLLDPTMTARYYDLKLILPKPSLSGYEKGNY